MRILVAALLFSLPALAAPLRVGLYPLALPDGQAQLAPAAPPSALPAAGAAPMTVAEARTRAARVLFGAGLALLAVGAGVGFYAEAGAGAASPQPRALTEARSPAARRAEIAALALAATGAGAIAAGGVVVALTPSGASLEGRF